MKTRDYTNYKKTLNSKNLILLATAGSAVLGMSSADSDSDEMGVYIEHIKDFVGLSTEDTVVYRTAVDRTGKVDAPSEAADIDLTLYGLRKFIKLALGGNPNLVNILFTPESLCPVQTVVGRQLQELRGAILSKHAVKAFFGYMNSRRMRMANRSGNRNPARQALIAANGFDTKEALHLYRLSIQCRQLVKTGSIILPCNKEDTAMYKKVLNGHYTMRDVLSIVDNVERDINESLPDSNLPDNPNYEEVEQWMLEVYRNAWRNEV